MNSCRMHNVICTCNTLKFCSDNGLTFNYYSWATALVVPILTFRKPVNESSRSTASGMHTTPCSRDAEYTSGK